MSSVSAIRSMADLSGRTVGAASTIPSDDSPVGHSFATEVPPTTKVQTKRCGVAICAILPVGACVVAGVWVAVWRTAAPPGGPANWVPPAHPAGGPANLAPPAHPKVPGILLGEYGFLTRFSGISEEEARLHVLQMVEGFNIREFQFYDAHNGYSRPPGKDAQQWFAPFGRNVERRLLMAYCDEIKKQGGRAWLYVQSMAVSVGDEELERDERVSGTFNVDDKPLFDLIVPHAGWANKIAPAWAEFAVDIGFAGIHWDTLGGWNHEIRSYMQFPAFLRTAGPLLQRVGLQQTANFVNAFSWDPTLLDDRTIVFPYMEVWEPNLEDWFYAHVAVKPAGGGVFVMYPGRSADHTGEKQNVFAIGISPLDLIRLRWQRAREHNSTYLAIGDGYRRIQGEYFPDTAELAEAAVKTLRRKVFNLDV